MGENFVQREDVMERRVLYAKKRIQIEGDLLITKKPDQFVKYSDGTFRPNSY